MIEKTINPNKTAPKKVSGPVSSCLFIICFISFIVTIYNRNPLITAPYANAIAKFIPPDQI